MTRTSRFIPFALVFLAACAQPAISIRYDFSGNEPRAYTWTVRASTDLDTPRLTESKNLRLVLRMEESREGRESEPARLRIVLVPEALTEDGATRSPGAPLAMTVEVDALGRVRSLATDEIPPTAFSALELDRLVTEFRPILSDQPVAIGGTWPATVRVDGAVSRIRLDGEGKLVGFRVKSGRRLAVVRLERTGNIVTSQAVGRAQVDLPGSVTSITNAEIDIDRGRLFSATSRSATSFTLAGQGGVLGGTLRVIIETEVNPR